MGKIYILIVRMYFINSIVYKVIYKIYKEIIIYGKINIELFRTILNNKEAYKSILKIDVKSLIFKNIKNLNLSVISYYYYCLVEKSIDYENDGYFSLKKEYFYKFKKNLMNLDIKDLTKFKNKTEKLVDLTKTFITKFSFYIRLLFSADDYINEKNLDSKIKDLLNEFQIQEILLIKKDILKYDNIEKIYCSVIYNYEIKINDKTVIIDSCINKLKK